MNRPRERLAIGTFAAAADVEVMVKRLQALGISRYELCTLPSDRPADSLRVVPGLSRLRPPAALGVLALRIYLQTSAEEHAVAGALLESAAHSVHLHDIDPPEEEKMPRV